MQPRRDCRLCRLSCITALRMWFGQNGDSSALLSDNLALILLQRTAGVPISGQFKLEYKIKEALRSSVSAPVGPNWTWFYARRFAEKVISSSDLALLEAEMPHRQTNVQPSIWFWTPGAIPHTARDRRSSVSSQPTTSAYESDSSRRELAWLAANTTRDAASRTWPGMCALFVEGAVQDPHDRLN